MILYSSQMLLCVSSRMAWFLLGSWQETQHLPNITGWTGSSLSFIFLDTWPALSADQPQLCKLSSVEVILVHSPFTQRTEAKLLIWFEVGWLPCHGVPADREFPYPRSTCVLKSAQSKSRQPCSHPRRGGSLWKHIKVASGAFNELGFIY